MKYTKLSRMKLFFILAALIFLFSIYREIIVNYLKFDVNAEDLMLRGIDGYALRRELLISGLNLENAMFNFNTEKIIFFPILILLCLKDYTDISKCFVKWNIGKNNKYFKELFKCKLELGIMPVLAYLFCVIVAGVIAFCVGGLKIGTNYFGDFLISESFGASLFNNSALAYGLLRVIINALMIYINAYFAMSIYDFMHNYLRSGLLYLAFIIMLSVLLYDLNLFYLAPMTAYISFTYAYIYFYMLFTPLITYGVCWLLMKVKKYEL